MPTEKFKQVSFKTKKGKKVNFKAKVRKPKYDFPKHAKKGTQHTIVRSNRRITFIATGNPKLKWKIIKNTAV